MINRRLAEEEDKLNNQIFFRTSVFRSFDEISFWHTLADRLWLTSAD